MAGFTSPIDAAGHEMIRCEVCASQGNTAYFHSLSVHLSKAHGINVATYNDQHPGAPTVSKHAEAKMQEAQSARRKRERRIDAMASTDPTPESSASEPEAKTPGKDEDEVLAFGVAELKVRKNLTEDDQAMVPTHDENYELDDKVLEAMALAIQNEENILAVGPTGCGKTSCALELAAIVNQPVVQVNLHGDIRAADFVGEKIVDVDQETGQAIVMWRDGILPTAMRNGYWLVLDELDAAPAAILFVLQAVLDDRRRLVLSANHGEVIVPDSNFRVIATANTLGRGDDSGLYTGTNILNEAFLDRFGTVLEWDYPSPRAEAKILQAKTGIEKEAAANMAEVARLVRSGAKMEECYCTFSLRRLIRWAAKTVALQGRHWRAAELTVFNKLTEDDRKYVQDVVQRVMGR